MIKNILVFESGKISGVNGICFKISKSIKNYTSIMFFVQQDVLGELEISEDSKMRFGCDKDNFNKWYMIIGKQGYVIRKEKNGIYKVVVNCPFNYILKKRQYIATNNIQILKDENAIALDVTAIFGAEELTLKSATKEVISF